MAVEIFLYDLLDWGGNIERTEPMTIDEVKKANTLLWEREPRLIRWAVSLRQDKRAIRTKFSKRRKGAYKRGISSTIHKFF